MVFFSPPLRTNNEQDLYAAQLQDVMRLKNESQHLRVIASQLSSFVSSIAAVTERLAPKLGQSGGGGGGGGEGGGGEQDFHCMSSLMEEINALQPDSQQRVDALRGAEEERQDKINNRRNPLDEELVKTKGLLLSVSVSVCMSVCVCLSVCQSVCLALLPYTSIHVNHIFGGQTSPAMWDQHLDYPQHVNYLHTFKRREMLKSIKENWTNISHIDRLVD